MKSILTKDQSTTKEKTYTENGTTYRIKAIIRYDDRCGNGHNTFSVTGEIDEKLKNGRWREACGGCIHDKIAKHFPELKNAIRFHLMSSDEPIHYIANTMYHAGDTDCHGLKKGEKRQIKDGKTGKLCWVLEDGPEIEKYVASDTKPEHTVILEYKPWYKVGEGKEPDLEAARRSAIWEDATLEQLRDKEALDAHLIELRQEFVKVVESFGFIY
jgi:hypothetical protein